VSAHKVFVVLAADSGRKLGLLYRYRVVLQDLSQTIQGETAIEREFVWT
jgi:hypothetical protein